MGKSEMIMPRLSFPLSSIGPQSTRQGTKVQGDVSLTPSCAEQGIVRSATSHGRAVSFCIGNDN